MNIITVGCELIDASGYMMVLNEPRPQHVQMILKLSVVILRDVITV